MKNKIIQLSVEEFNISDLYLPDRFIAELDGKIIQSQVTLFQELERVFHLPSATNWAGISDWLRDLDWLQKESYCLVINNYSQLLEQDEQSKKIFTEILFDAVLPFWEEEVKFTVVGGYPKEFIVYLID